MRGHIRRRSKSSWVIVINLGTDPVTGKRKQKWLQGGRTRKEAEIKLTEVLHGLERGNVPNSGKMTVAELLSGWIRDYAELRLGPLTVQRYRGIVDLHLIPALGDIRLGKLRPSHIQEAYGAWTRGGRRDGRPGGLTSTTILQHHRVLSQALSYAVRMGLAVTNSAQAVEPPVKGKTEMRALDGLEVQLSTGRSSY